MTLKDTLSNLSAHFKYYAAIALAEDGPQEKVRAEMMRQGWTFKNALSDKEMEAFVQASGMAGTMAGSQISKMKIFSPEGQEVFTTERNKELEDRYKQAVRQTAARTYGIHL